MERQKRNRVQAPSTTALETEQAGSRESRSRGRVRSYVGRVLTDGQWAKRLRCRTRAHDGGKGGRTRVAASRGRDEEDSAANVLTSNPGRESGVQQFARHSRVQSRGAMRLDPMLRQFVMGVCVPTVRERAAVMPSRGVRRAVSAQLAPFNITPQGADLADVRW